MLLQCFGVMGGVYIPATEPSVATVTVALQSAGSCSGTHVGSNAVVRASYTFANANFTAYTAKVYKDNVLRQTITSGSTTHDDYNAPGVSGDPHNATTVHWVWRVDMIRNADSAVISTKTAATYTDSFGDCNGPS